MRNLGALGAVAIASLVSCGVLGRPVPQRTVYPYPIYRSDDLMALDWGTPHKLAFDTQTRLRLFSAAFSKAVEVGFVNVIIRPHEHLVSLLRYRDTSERPPHVARSVNYTNLKYGVERSVGASKKRNEPPQDKAGDNKSEAFHSHGYRRSKNDLGSDETAVPSRDYRKSSADDADGMSAHSFSSKRNGEFARSSTHSTSREHLKVRSNALSRLWAHPSRE